MAAAAASARVLYRARMTLVTVGVLVWVPFMVAKYLLHDPFPVVWVLVIHIPCMIGALGLRLWQGHRDREGRSQARGGSPV